MKLCRGGSRLKIPVRGLTVSDDGGRYVVEREKDESAS
jgi:hypothetical protein